GIANRFRRRAPVADDAQAVEADERRTAVFRVVHPFAEAAIGLSRQQVADTRAERRRQLVVQQPLDGFYEPFADLERDVAGEAVTHDYIGSPGVDVASLDVANESDRRSLQKLVRLSSQIVALALLFTNREETDARRPETQGDACVRRSHQRELNEMLRPAF